MPRLGTTVDSNCASVVLPEHPVRAKLSRRTVAALPIKSAPYDCRDMEIKGFLLRVQPSTGKSPDGRRTWFLQYRTAEGRQTRIKLGDYPALSPEGARSIALDKASQVAKGVDLVARKRADREEGIRARLRTLRVFLDTRYEPWAKTHLKTAEFQLARIRSDFEDLLDRPMAEFSPSEIEDFRQRWKKDGLQARSINRDIQRLQSVLSRAVAWKVLDRHPFGDLKPLKTDKTGRVRFLTADEEKALRNALVQREAGLKEARKRFNEWRLARHMRPLPEREGEFLDHLRPMTLLAINTGLRRGELLSLSWADLNLSAKTLTVRAASAKSGHTRYLPLNTEALKVVRVWRRLKGEPKSDALVFPGRDGNRMTRVDTAWGSLMKLAGIENFRFHDLRHHFASRLVQAGVDLYTVKELLGHSEIAMTEKYSHLSPAGLAKAVAAI